MRISSFFICLLFIWLQLNTVSASPSQRLIVQVDTGVSADYQQTLKQQIKSIIKSDYTLLPHSTGQLWIMLIHPSLSEPELEKAINEMVRLDHVKESLINYMVASA